MADLLSFLSEPVQAPWMQRALVMGVLIGISGGLVGTVLVLRRMALVADSFSHALLPGLGIAYLIAGPSPVGLLVGAAGAGLLTAAAGGLTSRLTRLGEDAAFAAIFTLFMALGVAILGKAAPGDLLHCLFGSVLAVARTDLILAAATCSITILALALFYRWIVLECLDRTFFRASGGPSAATHAVILVLIVINLISALQSVGIVLCLALFILPATTAYLWCERFGSMLLVSATTGAVGAVAGIIASWHLDLPSGACIASCLGVPFLVSIVLAPRHGLLGRLRHSHRHLTEDGRECAPAPRLPQG